jgi:hypothetical protein
MRRSFVGFRTFAVIVITVALTQRAALAQQAASGNPPAAPAADPPAEHDAENADVSRQLANPIANMVSIPLQFNWAGPIAPFDSTGFVLNFQPVVPITLNDDWNLILRFILPFVGAPAVTANGVPESGTSDITASVFFSPAHSKLIWGVGPAFLFPTSTDPTLTHGKWAIGPTAVVLKEIGHWTVGVLVNQLWSYASMATYFNSRSVSQMFLQPFATLQMNHAVSLTFTSEETYDWKAADDQRSTVPIQALLGKVTRLGPFPFQVQGGGGYFVVRPDGAQHWMARLNFVLILPREHK